MEKEKFILERRLPWLKNTVAVSLMAGLLLSVKLWTGHRVFPRASLFNWLVVPEIAEIFLFAVLLTLLLAVLFLPHPRRIILAVLCICFGYALFDQMRWQPWFYQYSFMLATLVFLSREQSILNANRLIIASIYFFSGLQKMNAAFVESVFPWILIPIANVLPDATGAFILSISIVVPFVEVGIGAGLMLRKTRNVAVLLVILMSGVVLWSLGPWGHNWNSVVWPWNVAMALFAFMLFWRTEKVSAREIFAANDHWFQGLIILLLIVMPVFSFFNYWDSYPSWALYSGNTNNAQIQITDATRQKLPAEIRRFSLTRNGDMHTLDVFRWSVEELNVPPYPEARVFKAIARSLCKFSDEPAGIILTVWGKPTMWNKDEVSTYDCTEL